MFSLVGGHADGALEGLIQNLAEGGVRVNHHSELLHSRAGGDGVGALLHTSAYVSIRKHTSAGGAGRYGVGRKACKLVVKSLN